MLTPQQILDIVETLYPAIDELNVWITKDLIKRIMARMGRGADLFLTATDDWQLQIYQAAGGHLEAIQSEIARWTKLTDKEIRRIFEDAGIKALAYDSVFYAEHGLEALDLMKSEGMIRLLEDAYQRTAGTVNNFTRTTAQASQQRLIKLLDEAHMKVTSGAGSYTQVVEETLKSVVSEQTKVRYPTGHVDTIETAVLRAVRTGVAQAAGNMAIQGMEDRDWDVVLVSAHLGARYGDGGKNPGNHFWWQGKFYTRTGRTPDLPPFIETTGYGTGEGLCGWNCRHSFGPGDPRHNPYKDYDAEENKKAYDLSQKQRKMERNIRQTKTELTGLGAAVDRCEDPALKEKLEQDYRKKALLLEKQNLGYNAFCEKNGLKRQADRIQIAKWTREDAKRSIMAVKEKDLEIEKNRAIIKEKIEKGELSTKLSPQKYKQHIEGTAEFAREYARRQKNGQPQQSILTVTQDEAQELIKKYSGTGIPRIGKSRIVEYCSTDNIIGVYCGNKIRMNTNRFVIHYGKTKAHIVPDKPVDTRKA